MLIHTCSDPQPIPCSACRHDEYVAISTPMSVEDTLKAARGFRNGVEDMFVTHDKTADGEPVRFEVIEDEAGDTWWGYGHVPGEQFITEVNRWLEHTMGHDGEAFRLDWHVDHLYARQLSHDAERFTLEEPTGTEHDAHLFPVTRLWV